MPARSSRDGRAVDDLGFYNPAPDPSQISVNVAKARDWIGKGASPSDRVWKLLEIAEPGFKSHLAQPPMIESPAAEQPARAPTRVKTAARAATPARVKAAAAPKAPAKAKAAVPKTKAKAAPKRTASAAKGKS